jgi:predicted LPLAT superfamily acyltransferase
VLKNSSLVPETHNPMTSQNMQAAAAAALKFVKSKTSEEKEKTPTASMRAMVLSSYLSLRIGAPRASVDFSCVFLLFLLLFCAARLASRLELRRHVRTRRDARKP